MKIVFPTIIQWTNAMFSVSLNKVDSPAVKVDKRYAPTILHHQIALTALKTTLVALALNIAKAALTSIAMNPVTKFVMTKQRGQRTIVRKKKKRSQSKIPS